MTWTVKIKQTRPNTDVNWYAPTPSDVSGVIDSERRSSNKLVSVDTTFSDDGLERISIAVWKDEVTNAAHWGDSRVETFVSARNTYNAANGISLEVLQNEES